MGVYMVRISAEHGGETTVSVETDAGRVTGLSVRAPEGADSAGLDLAALDLPLLLRAVLPSTGGVTTGAVKTTSVTRGATAPLRARAYRRMPEDLAEVYVRARSIKAVAAHYGVPRHTAQGWMARLRDGLVA